MIQRKRTNESKMREIEKRQTKTDWDEKVDSRAIISVALRPTKRLTDYPSFSGLDLIGIACL